LELSRIMPRVQIHLIRVQFRSALSAIDRRRHGDYKDMVDAILLGDAKAAEKAAKLHLGRSIAALQAQNLAGASKGSTQT
jgi:DNA-binding GntR family transcriptional regulator